MCARIWPRLSYVCQNLDSTVLYAPESGLDCFVCASTVLNVPRSGAGVHQDAGGAQDPNLRGLPRPPGPQP